jgi:hypothetical protein
MRVKTVLWFKALLAAIISGIANAGLGAVGITSANMVGIPIPQLDYKQFVSLCVSGGIIGALMYLKQSPVPPDSTGDTGFIDKPTEPKP